MEIRPLTRALGAEVLDVDLGAAVENGDVLAALKQAFLDHHVLVFRGQDIDRETHKRFGRAFGELHVHPSQRGENPGDDREIFPVHSDGSTVLNNGGLWHSDVSCDATPPLGSMLYLRHAPETGGDTLFANMHLAYETLSAPVREMLDGLTAVHDMRQDIRFYGMEPKPGVDYPRTSHPIVVAHPDTGRRLLFVNSAFTTHIEGLTQPESRAVLTLLHDHVAHSPAIQCRVRWEPGTLTFWDNRCVQHYAVWDYRPDIRSGDRVTIAGTSAPTRA